MCREGKIISASNKTADTCLITFLKKYRSSHRRCRSSNRRCSVKNGVLKNFENFAGKPLCWSPFLIRLQAFSLQVLKKETLTQVLPCEACETFKNTYFEEHLQTTPFVVFYKNAVLKNFAIFTGRKQLVISVP